MKDPLTEAILSAGRELGEVHNWSFEDDGSMEPSFECPYTQVLLKHITPLMHPEFRLARIAALKAEIAALENS